jgi:3-hydroxymyristoyl/3-hydroxydecanoyl-(acyl carrier protein) dehydratase
MKFRLVDKILDWTPEKRILGIKTVSPDEYRLKEAFGDEPRLPETLLLESFLQLANWLILLSSDFQKMGMVIRLSKIQYHDFLLPGQSVEMEVKLLRRHKDAIEMTGEGFVGNRPLISGFGCLAVQTNVSNFVNASDLRARFSEIYQPLNIVSL